MLVLSVGLSLIQTTPVTAQTSPATLPDLKLSTSSTVFDVAVQEDGKLIISGDFIFVNDVPRTNIARLNPNGTVDLTWNPAISGKVYSIVPSGTNIYLGGSFDVLDDPNRIGLVRVSDLDGSTDKNWGPKGGNPGIRAIAVSGSDVYVGGDFFSIGGLPRGHIARLSAVGTGAVDPNWNPNANGAVWKLVVDGNDIFASGFFTSIGGRSRRQLAKLSASGSGAADPDWDAKIGLDPLGITVNMAISGTNLYVFGSFTNIGGIPREDLAKLSTLGSGQVDTIWSPSGFPGSGFFFLDYRGLAVTSDALFVNWINFDDLTAGVIKLDASGTGAIDTSWNATLDRSPGLLRAGPFGLFAAGNFRLCNDQVSLSLAKLDFLTGARDRRFNAQVQSPGRVYALAQQPDGKVIVGGDFWFAGGLPRRNLARINRDGPLDRFWSPDANGTVRAIAVSGTNAFVGGTFQKVGGLNRTNLAKLAIVGNDRADPNWDARISSGPGVLTLAASGTNLFVGSGFLDSIGGQSRNSLAKLSTTGSGDADPLWKADTQWDADSGIILSLALSGTNLYVGGLFTAVNGVGRTNIAKVSALGSGALDTNWGASIVSTAGDDLLFNAVAALAVSGTNLFVGGNFTNIGGFPRKGLARASALGRGLVDPSWDPKVLGSPSTLIVDLAVDDGGSNVYAGGKMDVDLGGGSFGFYLLARISVTTGVINPFDQPFLEADPSSSRARGLLATALGLLDWFPFEFPSGSTVNGLLATGRDLYVGGNFAQIGGATRYGFAFLPVADAPQLIQDTAADLFIARNPADGPEVTHFRITAITGGTLYPNDAVTPIAVGDFISVADGDAGLKFAPGGTVSAVSALNNTPAGAGTLATSLTMTTSPNPVFKFTEATSSVREGQGNIVVAVRKFGNGATVDYATSDITATGGLDYRATNGVVRFSATDKFKNIFVKIADDLQPEGDEQFAITLSNASSGAVIADPATATVTIVDDDLAAPIVGTTALPAVLSGSSGALTVSLTPPNANGRWRLVGQVNWHETGAVVSGLVRGNYEIEFRPVNGFRQPDTVTVPISLGGTNQLIFRYAATTTSLETGNFSVLIEPGEVATNANLTLRGQWRLEAGPADWLNSGDVVANLNAGSYTVEFKAVPGRVAPSPRIVQVGANVTSSIVGTYFFGTPSAAQTPVVVPFNSATTNPPYLYNGQIQTSVGFGSGFVVKPRVVVTAAHMLFDDVLLSYVTEPRWFFQRHRGRLEPVPQVPRGWYIFEGYQAQRELDHSPGVSTPASQNLDVAAMYFLEDAGRGGYGGYLSSDAGEYLLSANYKFLAGYPLDGVPEGDQGKLHATIPADLDFTRLYNGVFATTNIQSFPGNSGGPIYVQADVNEYLPAAIYLGGSDKTLVRAIDSEVVDMITRAEMSGNGGGNFTGGGVVPLSPGYTAPPFGTGLLTVNVTPADATNVRPGWRISGIGNTNYISDASATLALIGGAAYPIEFKPVPGFLAPSNRNIQMTVGQVVTMEADYIPIRPSLDFSYSNGLSLQAATGANYRLEHATNLTAPIIWTPLITISLSNSPDVISNTQPTNDGSSRFYRALLVP